MKKPALLTAAFTVLAAAPAVAQDMPADVQDAVLSQLTPTQALVAVLGDNTSLSEKLQRLEEDRAYLEKINMLADDARRQGWFGAPSSRTLLAVLHAAVNPDDVNANLLLGFEGTERDARNSATLDDNIADLIAASRNPENAALADPLLRFKAVRGTVQETALADAMDYYASYPFDASNIHLDPTPREQRLERKRNDENYREAWRTAATGITREGVTESMYFSSFAHLWDAYLNPQTGWETLSQVPDNRNDDRPTEFRQWSGSGEQRDNNIKAVLRARDILLDGGAIPLRLEDRAALFNAIDAKALEKIHAAQSGTYTGDLDPQHLPYTGRTIHLDPAQVEDKLQRRAADADYHAAYRGYIGDYRSRAGENNITQMLPASHIVFWSAMLDKDVTWQKIRNLDNIRSDTHSHNLFWDNPHSPYLNHNMKLVFEARNEILPEEMPQNLEERRALFDQVYSRALEKLAPYRAYSRTMQNDPLYAATNTREALPYAAFDLLKRAHTDMSITAENLEAAGLTAENPKSQSLAHNFNAVLEARAEIENPTYENVRERAGEKLDEILAPHKKQRLLIWSALATLLLAGGAGTGGTILYNRHRSRNPKPKPH